MIGHLPDRVTFLKRFARLLDVHVDVLHGTDDSRGLVHQPAGVGVGDEYVAALQLSRDGPDAFDISFRIAADLKLKFPIALGAVTGDFAGHRLWGFL